MLLRAERYNLVCFLAQQAAEKAVKAFLYLSGEERVIGHSVADLLRRASSLNSAFDTVVRARTLDLYYIPTRYPNGIPGGLPYEAFDREEGEKALMLAASVIDLVGGIFPE
jgi:HEPN domain-containing protein